jgi:UDP-N-acetyl-D-glucosamine dehydrogenase
MQSADLTAELLQESDCVVVVTDHTTLDYGFVAQHARLILDTRGVMRGIEGTARAVGLSG